jgi:hypothetical protein
MTPDRINSDTRVPPPPGGQSASSQGAQRAELDVAIADLKTQLAEGEKALAAFRKTASAA